MVVVNIRDCRLLAFFILILFLSLADSAAAGEVDVRVDSTRNDVVTVFTPNSYDGRQAIPLLVMLHGLGNSGPRTSSRWQLREAGNDKNFMWVAPTGTGNK